MEWENEMKENGDYERFIVLYDKRCFDSYMTEEEIAEYNALIERYIEGQNK